MNIFKKNNNLFYLIYFFLYLTLITGFIFDENPAGGGKKDYLLLQVHLIETGFTNGVMHYLFDFFPNGTLQHSPIYYIIIYYLKSIFSPDIIRLIIIHIFLIIPFYFYKSLKLINIGNKYICILIPIIFFISPNFRSVALWSGREILSLSFLIISIFNFIKFQKNKNTKNIYLSFFFLILGSYISPEIGIISIVYFYKLIRLINLRFFFKLFFFNLILSLPFLYYIIFFYSDNEFNNPLLVNLYKNLSSFFSSICIVTIPFIIFKDIKKYFLFILENKKLIIFILFISFFILNSPYNYEFGGGVIYRLLNLYGFEKIIFIFGFLGFLNLIFLIKEKLYYNLFVIIIFILHTSLNLHFFQKYIDLTYLFYFIFLFDSKKINDYFNNSILVKLFLTYNLIYYIANISYRIY